MSEMVKVKSEVGENSAYLAVPASGEGPGLLLMHAWWGLNDYFTELADRFAAEGYVVLAPDLYGGKTVSTVEKAEETISAFDWKSAIKVEEAALDTLLKHPAVQGDKVGAIGFSMGAGYAAWLSMLRSEVTAVVLFYGGSDDGDNFAAQTNAAVMGHFAEGDEWEPDEAVRNLEAQLRERGKEVAFYFYSGVGHWFMENNRPDNYDASAAATAWERTLAFLRDKLM